jgi:hypothetical protein
MRDQPSYRLIAAGVILIAWFLVAGILIWKALSAEQEIPNWNQVVVIFNAIGALATTASGVLFGAEIQQANVRNAQQDSQAHAADAARTREAALHALEAMESGPAASADGGAARARTLLQRAIAGGPA